MQNNYNRLVISFSSEAKMDGVTWRKSIPDCFRFTETVYRRYGAHIKLTHHSSLVVPKVQTALAARARAFLQADFELQNLVVRCGFKTGNDIFEVFSSFLLFHATRVSFFCHHRLCVPTIVGQVSTDAEISDLNGANMVK